MYMLFYHFHFQKIMQKVCLPLENLNESKNLSIFSFSDIFNWYLFQLNNLIKPDFNCCNSFAFLWVDKVRTGT